MSKLLKSKFGYLIAGIYLLVTLIVIIAASIIFVLRYSINNAHGDYYPFEEQIAITVFVLTLPWSTVSVFLGLLFKDVHTGRFVLVVGFVIGAIINAFFFYLLGYLISKAITYFSDSEKPVS